ncbi:MAG TPA: membrane protein insertase YidC [Pyrinomonadaceae bacterium]|nr:membrane protein insertase YidC [Pyrinomonadaceae bacterium]
MEQRRLLLALVLSALILFGWSYFFPPPVPPAKENASESAPTSSPSPTVGEQAMAPDPSAIPNPSESSTPQRTILVSTPLYDVELSSAGAVVKSWIIKRIKDGDAGEKLLYSISGTRENPQPLQLVSPEGARRGLFPLRLSTGRSELDASLANGNYAVDGAEDSAETARIELAAGEQKSLEFRLGGEQSNLSVVKRLTFDADLFTVRVETRVLQGGQPVPNVKMAVGPSIGDQGIPSYTFYSVAPEGVAFVGDGVERFYASEINSDKQSPRAKSVSGPVRWAGVGDTYFAMTLVLPRPEGGLEFRTENYQHQFDGQTEERFLITGYVPVPTDGTPTYLFAGPKDHDLLEETAAYLSSNLGSTVDLGRLIDYGWTGRFTKPLATPILWSIKHLNRLTGSYGIAIILFTVIIYMLFFPLKWRSSRSMKKAQKLAPRMKEIQEKMKGLKQSDPKLKELQMEQLRLMKEGNPLGGCLPLLIQMPFLIALYIAITISIDFRQSSFLWIPDLSAADPIRLLPILMAVSMLVLQLITPAPQADPLQRKMMAVIMPVMMLYILWTAPAGLLVYWLVGNLVGFGQQIVINRFLKSEDDEEPQPPEKNRVGSKLKPGPNNPRVSEA